MPATAPVGTGFDRPSGRRTVRLIIRGLRPLSVLRITFTFSMCVGVLGAMALATLWAVLNAAGAFTAIVHATNSLTSSSSSGHNTIADWVSFNRWMLIGGGLAIAWIVGFTLVATVGSFLYNAESDFVGGIEATLTEVQAHGDRF